MARFAETLLEMGAWDELHRVEVADHDTPAVVRRGVNPATGEAIEMASPTRTRLQAPADVVTAAEATFGIPFAQGCRWG